jgi:DNA repair ATPase RecN
MAQTDLERFTRLMLDEFGRVHERLDRHDERFDAIDDRFDRIDRVLADHDQRFDRIERELLSVRTELDALNDKVENMLGYRKEIDHALERLSAIEKHLGISKKVA